MTTVVICVELWIMASRALRRSYSIGAIRCTLFRPAGCFSCGFPSRPTRSKPLQGAKCRRGDRLKRQRSTSGYQPLDKIKCEIGPKVPHDPRVLLHRGTAGQPWAEKRNRKAPSVAGGAWKISVRGIQRTRNLFGSPAQGGLKNEREAHHCSRAIETAHNNSPKTKTNGPQRSCAHRGAAIRLTQQTERLLSVNHFTIGIINELPSWPISRGNGCNGSDG
jgi:hypothetical protein